jgi:Zn-dependent M28 family amino/carboxypeptidase
MGYDAREHAFNAGGLQARNIEAELPGTSQPGEIVVIGAHYDSVVGAPGANDNASGVAALLVLARVARAQAHPRALRFVAFVNEEPPFFQSWRMGSRVYARRCRERGERITAMVSLETLGYYTDAPRSQAYPFPFNLLYPDTANFVAFVGNFSSRKLLHKCVAAFRQNTRFPSEGAAAPEFIPGIGWSDHWAFWKEGYPAVMVTDTAFYRYGYYHTARDLPEQLSYDATARVVRGLRDVVSHLAAH